MRKALEDITEQDLGRFVLWAGTPSADGRLWLRSLKTKRTKTFANRLVATRFSTPRGEAIWGLLDGIHLDTPEFSKHWRQAYLLREDGKWFRLARYHDSDWTKHGPDQCARFFRATNMFPLRFDVSHVSTVPSELLTGVFERDPKDRIEQRELMRMLVRQQ